MTDLTASELDKALKQHQQLVPILASLPGPARCNCGWPWPCLVAQLAEEVKRRREGEDRQERMVL